MTLWILFALMTAAAILAVLWPLGRKPKNPSGGSDLLVYQDQLEEIGRDRTAGLIGEAEAEAARIEVSRRLLTAADARPAPSSSVSAPLWRRRAAAVTALVVLPLVAFVFYGELGSPNIPGQPAFSRTTTATPEGHQSIASLVGQVEAHLAANPSDGPGWEVIAPVYMRLGRFDDAVQAWRKALTLNGDTATRESDLGEAMVAGANGVVTDDAKAIFQRAVALDEHEPKARYFLGLAEEQDGNRDAAAKTWRALLQDSPPDAPWLGFVQGALTRVTGEPAPMAKSADKAAPGPSADQMAAAADMTEVQRNDMIRGMVAKLADQLHADGTDADGWLRLVRAYAVLGDRDKAKDAAADARRALASRPDAIKRVDDLVKGLGIEG
jgi:cytochrome c-type biogenesis protein CcmH